MAHKRLRDWPILCIKYGIKPLADIPQEILDVGRKQINLWNRLIEIARQNKETFKELLSNEEVNQLQNGYDEVKKQYEIKKEELKQAKIKFRTRKKSNSDLQPFIEDRDNALNVLREKLKLLREAKRKSKEALHSQILQEYYNNFFSKVNQTVKESGIYWCDAESIRDKFITSWRKTLKSGNEMHFRSFNEELHFEYRFTGGGLPIAKVMTANKRFRFKIKPIDKNIYSLWRNKEISQNEMKRRAKTVVTINIAGHNIQFKTTLYREISEKSMLKKVIIIRAKQGYNMKWSMSLTLEIPSEKKAAFTSEDKIVATAGIDVGYRIIDERLRVAVLVSNLEKKDIYIPRKILSSELRYKKIQKERDALLEGMKKELVANMPSNVPTQLQSNWHLARNKRLVKILHYLKSHDPEHIACKKLTRWFAKDARIYNEMSGLRTRSRKHRRWFYYNVAHEICRRYERICLEELNLAKMHRKPEIDDSRKIPDETKWYRDIAANGEFLNLLKYVALKYNTEVKVIDAAFTTMQCHKCGKITDQRNREKLNWICEHCGATWDQDVNAAENLMNFANT